jgi:hypothetical protein
MTGTHSFTSWMRRSSRRTGRLTGNLYGSAWEVSGESDAPPIHRKVDMNLPTQEGGAWGANRRCDGNICVRPCTSAAQFASSEWAEPTSGQALTRMTGTHSMTSRRRISSRRTGFSRATFTGQRKKSQGILTGNLHGPAWEVSGESDAPQTQEGGYESANPERRRVGGEPAM